MAAYRLKLVLCINKKKENKKDKLKCSNAISKCRSILTVWGQADLPASQKLQFTA